LNDCILVTCEHAGNRVPREFADLFGGREKTLASHRGYDPGALELARVCARRLGAPLFAGRYTRLLIELNRSPGHRSLFSDVTRPLSAERRARIVARYYRPYRQRVEAAVEAAARQGRRVVHLSVHTFTPVLAGRRRRADVGLLDDPRRRPERELAGRIKQAICARRTDLIVRSNYPYLGTSDGFTAALRRKHPAGSYVGIEIEVNQRWVRRPAGVWRRFAGDLADALREALDRARAAPVSK
jgi:predicted N-formylglutamate amidohydrolase